MSPYRLQTLIDRIRNPFCGMPHSVARARRSAASEIARLPPELRDDLGYGQDGASGPGYLGSAGIGVIITIHLQK
ncbi:hypothetical protein MRS76_16790 [Rhizobiaceae bacterium n13]|uniref:Uncharacterized protein n=1 Tax=Ferirhizobium litorale TaxID=2927786 RepID=A0AAE3QHV6_9HYPH|nr:hypothetical protein [Fererhizobium litorale]MDI7863615.1 hypothetical protein [Fererhizobium litorale]MDI7923464.1 hypothetical protein [Fererhizobium litorale]